MGLTDHDRKNLRRQFLFKCLQGGVAAVFTLFPAWVWSRQKVILRHLRVATRQRKPSVIFELSASVGYRIFVLHKPERIVIDFDNTRLLNGLNGFERQNLARYLISNVRYGSRNGTGLRVVLDLRRPASPRSFLLPPTNKFGHRLVVELHSPKKGDPAPILTANKSAARLRDVVVAIDAGHGGKDPGAIGKRGTKEKDVVLAIARKLESLIRKEKGMRAVMIRRNDTFMPLRARIQRARENKADIFVSIHADAARNSGVRGSSVYVLSQNGASSEAARWLAVRENAADVIGGVSLEDKDDLLKKVLLDLSQNATIEASMKLANDMLSALKRAGKVHSNRVEQAGFVVLKSPDIPSVLVESAFISNPREEKRLRSASFQLSIAKSLMRGLRQYLHSNAPSGTLLQSLNRNEHIIRSGETLSAIAQRYEVDVNRLRRHNSLKSDRILEGQVLLIPRSDS